MPRFIYIYEVTHIHMHIEWAKSKYHSNDKPYQESLYMLTQLKYQFM